MPTTSQPSAGTALHADWTTNCIFARNEVETTATVTAAGSMTRAVDGTGVTFGSDSDGRYKLAAGSSGGGTGERWSGTGFGPTYTLMSIVKWSSSGGSQTVFDSDGGNRRFQFYVNDSRVGRLIGFDSGQNVDAQVSTTQLVSNSGVSVIVLRVRNDAGTYKAKIWIDGVGSSEISYAGTPGSVSSGDGFGLVSRVAGGNEDTAMKRYFSAAWSTALSDTDCAALSTNGWTVYDAKSGGDTTAPVLTSPTATATGATTATVGATTDEGNGTLYAVVTAGATTPSAAQVIAGQDSAGAAAAATGSVAVSSTGAKTIGITGLTASTSYYAHLCHRDAASNSSNVVTSAQFTTSAAASSAIGASAVRRNQSGINGFGQRR